MKFSFLKPLSNAAAAPRSLRQARRDRQANRALCALFGLVILTLLLAKFAASAVAEAETSADDQPDNISAALPQADPANPAYVIDSPDILLFEGGAELPTEVAGEHIVGPDGTIDLGTHGLIRVAGLTLAEAKLAVADQLKLAVDAPLSVKIQAFNSNVYYVVVQRDSSAVKLVRLPITGNETVLDVLAPVNDVCPLSGKNLWIARPVPGAVSCDQILPVSWPEITAGGVAASNYQVLPGDWLYIASEKQVTLDNWIDWLSGPIERAFGCSVLMSSHRQPPQLVTYRGWTFPGF